ncbi:nitroreductase [Nocardioides sp. NPDC057577]|uniref:nitroreductase n=1 Tax=Nocardioides sp. NPDC057577 TaxID=3346171 RepID=UPI00367191CA
MDVFEAVDTRRAVRAFSDKPVPRESIERVLDAATRAPSSGNLQPWHLYVVAGEPLAGLKQRASARAAAGDPGDDRQYPMYPDPLTAPYSDRFTAAAAQRYQALGIERDDPDRPRKIAGLNTHAFGAPVVMFCYIEPSMGPGQWADVGMYLQTVMLLLRAEGLHSCPQVMWTMFHRSVREAVRTAADRILLCGLSVGFEDDSVPRLRTDRAPMQETVTMVGI